MVVAMQTGQAIERIVKRIVRRFHPEKIILFGSHARGDAGPDSDVDLLIVMRGKGDGRDKALEVRGALRGIGVSTDIFVTNSDEFAWRKDIVGTIEYPAAREGKLLHARV